MHIELLAVFAVLGLISCEEPLLCRGRGDRDIAGTAGVSAPCAPDTCRSFFVASKSFGRDIDKVRFFFRPTCGVAG